MRQVDAIVAAELLRPTGLSRVAASAPLQLLLPRATDHDIHGNPIRIFYFNTIPAHFGDLGDGTELASATEYMRLHDMVVPPHPFRPDIQHTECNV